MRKVRGVGINDTDDKSEYTDSDGCRIKNMTCKRWETMLGRCYSGSYQRDKPSYKGAVVCEEWKLYSNFKFWLEAQQGWEMLHLDKDFLGNGKLYSPDTCCLIPHTINNLLHNASSYAGRYPCGVIFDKRAKSRPYRAEISVEGKSLHIGTFATPNEAHAAWQKEKIRVVSPALTNYKNKPYFNQRVGNMLVKYMNDLQQDLLLGRQSAR